MNLFELFVKIGAKDEASGTISKITKGLGKGLVTAAKIGTAAVGAAAAGIAGLTAAAVNSFAEYEQLAGGAQKIFDQMDYSKIATDANNAYKELGLSANQYLAVINDVGATFAATMGDEAGYEAAKTGLKAISDYASGTGKNVDELSQKFTLITRSTSSYQSIADQFSGILPATSKDFLKQAQAAGFLSGKYKELTKVPINEYQSAVSKMLEKGVKELGLYNNTVIESGRTISGSLSAAKGAWANLVSGLADDNADLSELINNFVITLVGDGTEENLGVLGNILPAVETALAGAGTLITGAIPKLIEILPGLLETIIPVLLESADSLVNAVIEVLPQLVDSVVNNLIDHAPDMIVAAVELILALAGGLIGAIPDLLAAIPKILQETIDGFKNSEKIKKFLEIGKNIVEGIKDGIKNAWNNLKEWFKGLFDDIIGIAKKILGIASPSKVFKKLGYWTAEGYGIGFEDEFSHVRDDMEKAMTFDDMAVDIGSSIRHVGSAVAGSQSSGYGGTQDVNVTVTIDENVNAMGLARELLPYLKIAAQEAYA